MAPDPQVLERLYTEKAALAQGRQSALTRLAYVATVLDNYAGTTPDSIGSASAQIRKAQTSLIYLDVARQARSFAEVTSDPNYSRLNSSEQASQLTVLAQTDIAITKATAYGHADTANNLAELKNSFQAYSTRVADICDREQDADSPYASSTASPASTEAHPTQPPPTTGPAYPTIAGPAYPNAPAPPPRTASAARTATSYRWAADATPNQLRHGEQSKAWEWAKNHLNMDRQSYGNYPPDDNVINLFRTERGEIPYEGLKLANTSSNSAERYRNLIAEQAARGARLSAKVLPKTEGLLLAEGGDFSKATFHEWRVVKYPLWTPQSSNRELARMNYPIRVADAMKEYEQDRDGSRKHNARLMANAPQIPQHPQNPAGQYASRALPPQGHRQGNTQTGPATQQPAPGNAYQNPPGGTPHHARR
ncbi:hypothetical protein [Streptomyces hokutonensis]|uniref:hypothetical protein n=1 Tax=Streptomyces hokutonensis TaxID=1306990 RepID=UPI003814658D